ncbi:riboflavin biosynthesis pyrimidine reductase [Trichococcus patagoniensis]|uniref:Riboflavin biosynthesis pyrimidine reductase n=1 Tax=Trichococcus patagoniensis TaxID=382641 RepID=A0A2T5IKE4_9LACT|nr:RibD family protein [Trichococcus patagoniensis]PTQ84289.1 riboflavin biosynthesis pyrimidine reductase [Trichococcus patagoniensis]
MLKRPYVIIHTHTSLDGKINSMKLPEFQSASQQYQELALDPEKQVFNIQGYLNGRITTDDNTTHYREPELNEHAQPVPPGDFIAKPTSSMYYVSIDPSGKLGWQQNYVDYGNRKSHVIEVLTEKASNAYKDFLRRLNISYIIAGKDMLDKELALHKLATDFNMQKIMIGGGGTLNWAFLQNGLVDEVSIVMAPIADGDPNTQTLFMAKEPLSSIDPTSFSLIDVRPLKDSTVWLRYKVIK